MEWRLRDRGMNWSKGIWRIRAGWFGDASGAPLPRLAQSARRVGFCEHQLETCDQKFPERYLFPIRTVARHPWIDELPPKQLIGGQSG